MAKQFLLVTPDHPDGTPRWLPLGGGLHGRIAECPPEPPDCIVGNIFVDLTILQNRVAADMRLTSTVSLSKAARFAGLNPDVIANTKRRLPNLFPADFFGAFSGRGKSSSVRSGGVLFLAIAERLTRFGMTFPIAAKAAHLFFDHERTNGRLSGLPLSGKGTKTEQSFPPFEKGK